MTRPIKIPKIGVVEERNTKNNESHLYTLSKNQLSHKLKYKEVATRLRNKKEKLVKSVFIFYN